MNLALLLLLIAGIGLPNAAPAKTANPAKAPCSTRVLFLGNSYTYFNDLPALLSALAQAGHQCSVKTRMIAPGGVTLKDHWENPNTRAALKECHWDYVVLQDQSSLGMNYYLDGYPRVTGDELFLAYAKKWAEEIQRQGAKTILYLTWSRKATPDDQLRLNYAYIHAANETGAIVAPVGIAWQSVRELKRSIDLYYKDGSHPSQAGSYLAACTLFATLFHHSPDGLPSTITGAPVNLESEQLEEGKTAVLVDLSPADAAVLQKAAWNAWHTSKDRKELRPVAAPAPAAHPPGDAVSGTNVVGTWRGQFLFYPGVGPVKMILNLRANEGHWIGHLDIEYPDKSFPAESLDLVDLKVDDRELSFSDAASVGVNKWRIDFLGSLHGLELIGTARTIENLKDGSPISILGDWSLRRE